jgi:DNA-binding transcriptional MerR regulator
MEEESWTLTELADRAAQVLRTGAGDDGPSTPNGRVREVPSARLIRWYTTIGLVDPPLTRRGRIALYGRRHLLQLVAVKRLQGAGRSIADIQARLAGATDAQLTAVATAQAEPRPARRDRFWSAPATAPAPAAPAVVRPATTVPAFRPAHGVTIVLDGALRDPAPADLEALAEAAAPLLDALRERGLLAPHAPMSAGPSAGPPDATAQPARPEGSAP